MTIDDRTEWLEADGAGGFASGTVSGIRTRRYHAMLLPATTPPTGRVVMVNGFEAWVETASGPAAITSQRYAPDVVHPDGASRIARFDAEPWPTWEFQLPDGARLRQEIFVARGGQTAIAWTLLHGEGALELRVRPLISGRDYHSTHHENPAFRFDAEPIGGGVSCRPYHDLPAVELRSNGRYAHAPEWYRNFCYRDEQERGLDAIEDLASPGVFEWRLTAGSRAVWILSAADHGRPDPEPALEVERQYDNFRATELARRRAFASPLDRAADAYLVRRGAGRTIVAGYPWFTDWGRDTFIAIRGLCLATGRLADARDILVEWAGAVSDGMLPNRFPDRGEAPEFNSVDASLWFVIAAHECLAAPGGREPVLSAPQRRALERAILQIVSGYASGTRFGIRMDHDGLLAAGIPGVQLTWMDARVGGRVVTPRIGKPVEVQALWLNALAIAGGLDRRWNDAFARGRAAFVSRFWSDASGHLTDVVDVLHVRGMRDESCRPNQILAVGGLPIPLLDRARALRVVEAVERRLLTPIGLRSLAPGLPEYVGRYEGDSAARDSVYHQGTVWPWLMGPFVEAWVRVHGDDDDARDRARTRFLEPMRKHLKTAGLGHISEIADADPPFTPRGCPFQAWSLGEFLRLDRGVLVRQATGSAVGEPEVQWG
jgi:predicted glycogen debranching enzyme